MTTSVAALPRGGFAAGLVEARARSARLRSRFPLPDGRWTIQEMADALRVSRSTIDQRRHAWLSWEEADEMAIKLGVEPQDVWPDFDAITDRVCVEEVAA